MCQKVPPPPLAAVVSASIRWLACSSNYLFGPSTCCLAVLVLLCVAGIYTSTRR